jgi:hypothetical protein
VTYCNELELDIKNFETTTHACYVPRKLFRTGRLFVYPVQYYIWKHHVPLTSIHDAGVPRRRDRTPHIADLISFHARLATILSDYHITYFALKPGVHVCPLAGLPSTVTVYSAHPRILPHLLSPLPLHQSISIFSKYGVRKGSRTYCPYRG